MKKRSSYAKPIRAFCITAITTTPVSLEWRNLTILTEKLLEEIQVWSAEAFHSFRGEINGTDNNPILSGK